MTHHLFTFLGVAAISVNSASLSAHVGERLYPISYLSEEALAALDQDDASVEDWVEAVGEPTLTPLDFDLDSGPHVLYDQYDPSNLDFRIWLGWGRNGKIHVAGQFADNLYFNEFDNSRAKTFGFFDSITLMVDGDHTGGQYWFEIPHGEEIEGPLETNMQAQFYQAISRAPEGPLVDLPWTRLEVDEWWMVHPPFARGGGAVLGENPTFWSVEFYVTCFDRLNHLSSEDSEVSQLSGGKIIGFDIYVLDFDNDSELALYYLGRPDASDRIPDDASALLDGVLLGPGIESGETAVQSVSWGRIKASLEIDLRREDRSGKD